MGFDSSSFFLRVKENRFTIQRVSLLAQDPNARYKVRPRESPRKFLKSPEDDPQAPTAKVPAKVMVPVPVPAPAPVAAAVSPTGDTGRYKINMSGQTPPPGPITPPQVAPTTASPMQGSVMQPLTAQPPAPGDTATAPQTSNSADQPQEIPAWLTDLHKATAQLAADESAPAKHRSRAKAFLQMLAYGAKDMPVAHDWSELAYGAGRAVGSGAAGIAKPDLPGEIEKRYRVAADQERVTAAQKTATIGSQIASRQSADDARTANTAYKTVRLGQFKNALDEKKAHDTWVEKHGDKRSDDYQNWVKWREANGDRAAKSKDDYFAWQKEVKKEDQKQKAAEFDWRKESKKLDQQIARERIAATEHNKTDRLAGDRAEADMLDQQSEEIQQQADAEDPGEYQDSLKRLAASRKHQAELKRAKISGVTGEPMPTAGRPEKTYPHTEAEARAKAALLPPAMQEEYIRQAREQGLIPPK